MSDADQWMVVYSKPNRERWAQENIVRQGWTVYCPLVVEQGRIRPLFPRYLFVQGFDGRWLALRSTFGVAGVVMDGPGPAYLRHAEILALKAREDANGVLVLPLKEPPGLKRGQKVRVDSGVLLGHEGIYEGLDERQRVQILMECLGAQRVVTVAKGERVRAVG